MKITQIKAKKKNQKKIQVYPSDEVIERLKGDAEQSGKSISRIIVDIVEEHYGVVGENDYLEDTIIEEIEDFIYYFEYYVPFELADASETFRNLEGKNANAIKASVGRRFGKLAETGKLKDVSVRKAKIESKTMYSLNNAILYERYVPEYENGTYKETEEYQNILESKRFNSLYTPEEISDELDYPISLVRLYFEEVEAIVAEEIYHGIISDPWGYEVADGYMDFLCSNPEGGTMDDVESVEITSRGYSISWEFFYNHYEHWNASAALDKVYALEDIGTMEEVVEVITYYFDEEVGRALLERALQSGAKLTPEHLAELSGTIEDSYLDELVKKVDEEGTVFSKEHINEF